MFLLPETVSRQDGKGEVIEVDSAFESSDFESRAVRLTLGITGIIAQENLDVSVWGSEDGHHWRLLLTFPQKFYCGTYSTNLDLSRHPDVKYLRAEWKMGRWIQDERSPLFEFYLLAGELREVAANAGR
jgi:hypothetical protein